MPRHPAAEPEGRPDADDRETDDAGAVLQPSVAGERPPWASSAGIASTPHAALVREQVPHDVAQRRRSRARRRSRMPRHDDRPPLPPSGATERRRQRRSRAARGGPGIPAAGSRDASQRGDSSRTAGRSTHAPDQQQREGERRPSRAARRSSCVVRSAAADPRTKSGRSGAIAPIAIAAGTSGVRTNGSATTAWLGVNGMSLGLAFRTRSRLSDRTKTPASVFLPRRSTETPPGQRARHDRRRRPRP